MHDQKHTTNYALGVQADPGSVPLVIGVIGHRDPLPSEIGTIAECFQLLLKQMIDACPATPIWMLNGLAEGMDSIAAEVFLRNARNTGSVKDRIQEKNVQDRLIAVLPKNKESYINDFNSEPSKKTLHNLLGAATTILEPSNNNELRSSRDLELNEPECYAVQGDFIAKNAYIMIAFFDGIDSGLVGGTAHTLAIHKGDVHPLFRSVEEILGCREEGKSITIYTPRISNRKCLSPAGVEKERNSRLDRQIIRTCSYIDNINKQIGKASFQLTQFSEIEGSYTKLWSYSDRVASDYKKRYQRVAVLLVLIGFILIATIDFYKDAQALGWGLILIAFALFPTIQKRLQKPFLTYRCLTESLTIQYIWSSNGIKASAADLIFSHDQEEIERIRVLLRAVALQLMISSGEACENIEYSLDKCRIWIKGQRDFLSNRIGLFRRLGTRWKTIAYSLAGAGIAIASIQLWRDNHQIPEGLVGVFLAGFASSLAYQELMGYEQTYRRYAVSLRQFERALAALNCLEQAKPQYSEGYADIRYRQNVVLEAIGKEKIDELNEWTANQLEKKYRPG